MTVGQLLNSTVASQAVYFDFETLGGKGAQRPVLLGWLWDPAPDDAGAALEFRQAVVDQLLWPAAHRTVPMTGGTRRCTAEVLDDALEEIAELLDQDGRYLVSWSTYDRDVFVEWCTDENVAAFLYDRYRDGKKTAKRWLRDCRPWIELKDQGWKGRHRLAAYLEMIGMPHPRKYGEGVAAAGIKTLTEAFECCDYYAELSKEEREAWKRVLGHNYWDCLGAYSVVVGASRELEGQEE